MAFKKNSRVKYFPERILKRISESEHYPLTIISGTMGYGKTTLARHYCKMNNLTAIWITIISSSLKVLWEQFCDGVREYHIDIADTLIFPSDDMKLAGCIRQLQHVAAQFTIVLDNFHLVKCDNLVRFIISVINAIPAIRIILISREKILGLKHELNLDGKVNYIYTDDLMFTISEIRSYFKACGVMLKIEDAQKLFQLTEGWIAILYKMLLAYFETNEVNELHEIQAIVKELFYEPLSDEIKAFLDCIAIFPDFTLELAEKMYKKEAGNLLSHLINNNHLIFYDKAHNTYRFHYLFYTCMREHFDRLQKSKKKKIFHTAGAYYEQQQQYKKAMAYYDLAESYDELMLCFEINRNRDLDSLDLNDMISYFQNCPIYIIKYHHMARLLLSLYLYSYNHPSYIMVLDDFQEFVSEDRSLGKRQKSNFMCYYYFLIGVYNTNNINTMGQYIDKAYRAAENLESYIPWQFNTSNVAYPYLVLLYSQKGCLDTSMRLSSGIIYKYQKLTNGHNAGMAKILEAEIYYYRGEMVEAEICSQGAQYQAMSNDQWGVVLNAIFLDAKIALFQGKAQHITELFQAATKMKQAYPDRISKKMYELCEAYFYIIMKRPEKVAAWIKDGVLNSLNYYMKPLAINIYISLLLCERKYTKVLGLADQMLDLLIQSKRLLPALYMYIHLAVAAYAISKNSLAGNFLKKAFQIASADGLIFPLVEYQDRLAPLIDGYFKTRYSYELSLINQLASKYRKSTISVIEKFNAHNKNFGLTAREYEIALLVSDGLSNKSIAERLMVTENTVSQTLKSVYLKLNVRSRTLLANYFHENSLVL